MYGCFALKEEVDLADDCLYMVYIFFNIVNLINNFNIKNEWSTTEHGEVENV